jgi:hypothetical protein
MSFGLVCARLRLGDAKAIPAVAAAVFERKRRRFMANPLTVAVFSP